MEQIKILFFIVGTFFGVEQSRLIAEKTTVTINPLEKTLVILQENLITIMQQKSDSVSVANELEQILKSDHSWNSEFDNYTTKESVFFVSEDKQKLHLKLTLSYSKVEDLKAFGIDINKDGNFSMTNFPKSNTSSKDGELGERYWNFKADTTFTFTEEPLLNMPEQYQEFKKSLLPFYLKIKS